VDQLPNPHVPGYVTLDARLGWRFAKDLEISLAGFNLFDRRHPEFGIGPNRSEVPRQVYVKMLWKM
jgi:iron complex outermembrane receptor protein